MKTTHISILLFICTAILIVYSCQENEEQPEKNIQGVNFVNPVQDLVACTDPFSKVLYVLEEHERDIIKKLNAEPLDSGKYKITATTMSGKKAPFIFSVKQATLFQLQLYISQVEAARLNLFADRDTNRAELIQSFRDRLGIFYRAYKNAECTRVWTGDTSHCGIEVRLYTPDLGYPDSIRSYQPPRETGRYITFENQDVYHCLKGNDYCIEALVVTSIKKAYSDPQCRQLIAIEEFAYNYSCLQ